MEHVGRLMQLWLFVTTSAPSIKVLFPSDVQCSWQDSFKEDGVLGLSQLAALDALVELCSVLVAEVATSI